MLDFGETKVQALRKRRSFIIDLTTRLASWSVFSHASHSPFFPGEKVSICLLRFPLPRGEVHSNQQSLGDVLVIQEMKC